MNIFATIGAWLMVPFMSLVLFFGGHASQPAVPAETATTTVPVSDATTTEVSIYAISPTSAAVGDTVSITGFGFTASNTVFMDGNVAAKNVKITSTIAVACTTDPSCHPGIRQTITFVVPTALSPYCAPGMMCAMYMREVTPGTYHVTVQNEQGTSKEVVLKITGAAVMPQ